MYAMHLSEASPSILPKLMVPTWIAGADYAGDLSVNKCCISTLCLWAGDSTMACPVVVQELLGEVSASNSDGSTSRDISVNKESGVLPQRAKLREHIFTACNHLRWVICSNVCGKQLGLAC